MTRSTPWLPWVDGDLAAGAREAVQAIAAELPGAPGELPDGARPEIAAALRASLASGQAGQALFHAYLALDYLALETEDEACSDRALALLDEATDAVALVPMSASFFSGFPGISWVTDHLRGRLFTDEDGGGTSAVDDALLGRLSRSPRSPWPGGYDLVNGLAGLGVCALEGLPRPGAKACLERIIERLAERAELSSTGAAWLSPPETLPDDQRAIYPAGLYDLGMAHGAAGVIALLGAACQARLPALAGPLLERSVAWLLARRQEEGSGACFPHYSPPGAKPGDPARPSRLAWCYGDAGIAQSLWIAARAMDNSLWERAALDVALSAAGRASEAARVSDACLCHGAAGLAHLFGRLFQNTGDECFAVAGRRWLAQELDFRRPGQGAGGFLSWETRRSGAPDWWDDRGFLEGAAGIGLALLAAVSTVEPEWDRVLLMSAR